MVEFLDAFYEFQSSLLGKPFLDLLVLDLFNLLFKVLHCKSVLDRKRRPSLISINPLLISTVLGVERLVFDLHCVEVLSYHFAGAFAPLLRVELLDLVVRVLRQLQHKPRSNCFSHFVLLG